MTEKGNFGPAHLQERHIDKELQLPNKTFFFNSFILDVILFAVKIMLFISDTKYYIPTKWCKMAGTIHLFQITGALTSDNVKLKRNKIWDIIGIYGKEVLKQGFTWFTLASNYMQETV